MLVLLLFYVMFTHCECMPNIPVIHHLFYPVVKDFSKLHVIGGN